MRKLFIKIQVIGLTFALGWVLGSKEAEAKDVPLNNTTTCLTAIMLREAASEPPVAQDAVAHIPLERMKQGAAFGLKKGGTICDMVKRTGFRYLKKQRMLHLRGWEIGEYEHLRGRVVTLHTRPNPVKGRMFFNKPRSGKKFRTPYKPVRIGAHIFY